MRVLLTYCCLLTTLCSAAQTPFGRVRVSLLEHSSLVLLDSCSSSGYCNDSSLYYRTLIHLRKGEFRQAERSADKLSKAYPAFQEVHYLYGILFFARQNYGRSVTEFNLALAANPRNTKALYNRSVSYGMLEEYLSAIEDLDACIQMNPAYTQAWYSRAYWYEFTGNYIQSAKDYEATLQLDPSNYDAWIGLAYSYQSLGEKDKACETLSRAIANGSQAAVELKEIFCR